MGWKDWRQGWQNTRTPAVERLQRNQQLDAVLSGHGSSDGLQRVHDAVRSSARLHTRVHWVMVRVRWRAGDRLGIVALVPPLLLAPVASVGRRLGGLDSEAPADRSLWATWSRVVRTDRQEAAVRPTSHVEPPS